MKIVLDKNIFIIYF